MAKDRIEEMAMDGVNLDSLPRWLRDMIDLNNEMAGRETGRVKRFLTSENAGGPEAQEREKKRRFTDLMRRLLDPEYARLYTETANTITRAEDAAERALLRLDREAGAAGEELEAIRSRAAELADGRKVFLAKDGRIYAEDGSDVTALRGSITGLRDGAPGWEEYKRAAEKLDEIERQRLDIERYRRDVLDPAKQRLGDVDNAPDEDELREIMSGFDEQVPEGMRPEFDAARIPDAEPLSQSAAEEYLGSAPLNAPDVLAEFEAASASFTETAPPRGPFVKLKNSP